MAEDEAFRWVATFETGNLPGSDVGVQISSSTSSQQAAARHWDVHYFAMSQETARRLAKAILIATGDAPPPPKAGRH